MAVRTREEIMGYLNELTTGQTDDRTLAIIEDITDTFNAYGEAEDWRQKYDDLDRSWRDRYRERFFAGEGEDEEVDEIDTEKTEKRTYDDLFKEEEK